MVGFGDYEPEDAWDASDDRPTHVHNLILRLALLDDHLPDPVAIDESAADVLDRIELRIARIVIERALLTNRDHLRIADIIVDLIQTRNQA